MSVHMIELQPRLTELAKLGVNLGAQLLAQVASEKIAKTGANRAICEFAGRIYESWNFLVGQGRMSAQQCQMQTDSKRGILFCQFDRFGTGGFIDHQTGGGKNSLL